MDTGLKQWKVKMMSNYAKRYRKEFKEEAVRLLLTSGKTAAELGRELGVSGMTLGTWREQAIRNGEHPPARAAGPTIHSAVLKLENIRLQKELEITRQERDILKKSLGILPRARSRKGMP
jgi:transposase